MNYYNEHDPFAAAWLRELIRARLIPAGEVDERDIQEVTGDDVRCFTQCHFFAGIGGWSYALHLAGWPTEKPVWTGSCPCQPFSAAGEQRGTADDRHLWPEFFRLIAECRPAICFGEQVASKLGREWLDGVSVDLEALDYAFGAADLCAASVGSPHIRQRLWWVGQSTFERDRPKAVGGSDNTGPTQRRQRSTGGSSSPDGLADAAGVSSTEHEHNAGGRPGSRQDHATVDPGASGLEHATGDGRQQRRAQPKRRSVASGRSDSRLGDSSSTGLQERIGDGRLQPGTSPANPWQAFELASCRDGKARRLEPGSPPLAHGIPNRVGRLRGYGNAICPQVAAEFIKAYCEAAHFVGA